MLKQLLAQAANGFSIRDIPFLFLQLSISAILAWIIRYYWRNAELSREEDNLLDYLLPLHLVLTVIAVFSLQSPWLVVLFGFISIIPVVSNVSISNRSRVFYIICLFISFGCGAANLVVTSLISCFILIPVLFLNRIRNK